MPASADDSSPLPHPSPNGRGEPSQPSPGGRRLGDEGPPGQTLAVAAEGLYIANLLLAPGLCFIILLRLYFRHRASAPALAVCHLRQTVSASIWAGVLLVIANLAIFLLGGYTSANTWTVAIIYFTTCHSTLVLLGILGLAKAMAGQNYVFPLIGRRCNG